MLSFRKYQMMHTEHFRKADCNYEIRFDNNGNVIHCLFKDGEVIVYPTLWDMFVNQFETSDSSAFERFDLSEENYNRMCNTDEYNYYTLKSKWAE
jgi:hypothetical protein